MYLKIAEESFGRFDTLCIFMRKIVMFTSGLIAFVAGIEESEIQAAIKKFRKENPKSKISDNDLRPYIINAIKNKNN